MLKELQRKYELAMKEKMLARLERDRIAQKARLLFIFSFVVSEFFFCCFCVVHLFCLLYMITGRGYRSVLIALSFRIHMLNPKF